MVVYTWPIPLIRDLERVIKRFLWRVDTSKQKFVTVGWNMVCLPIEEGALGLKSISKLNEDFKLKLAWELVNFDSNWTVLLCNRVTRKNNFITHHIFSSIWSSVKQEMNNVLENFSWYLGNGRSISLSFNYWCGFPSFLHSDALDLIEDHLVNLLLVNSSWDFYGSAINIPISLQVHILNCHIPLVSCPDKRYWDRSLNGDLSLKLVDDFKRFRGILQVRWKLIWKKYFPPSISFMVWRLLHHKLPSYGHWKRRGFSFPSRFSLCGIKAESEHHFFFGCWFTLKLWS